MRLIGGCPQFPQFPILLEDFGKSSVTKGDADLRNTQHGMRTSEIMSCPWKEQSEKWESPKNASGIIIQYQYPITVIPVSRIDAGDVGIPGSTNT